MAAPYLFLAAFPQLVGRIPRTGPASELVKQVMGLLMLETAQGQTIRVVCEGDDAAPVMDAVEQLVAARFDEAE